MIVAKMNAPSTPAVTPPSYLLGLSPSIRCAIKSNARKTKLGPVFYNSCPSVNINPRAGAETMIPVLPCNSDPATIDIPIKGKVLVTWALCVLWTGVMLMTCIVGNWEFAPMKINPMYGPSSDVLVTSGAISPEKIDDGEWWRILWATQMHAGWIHLAMNVINFLPLGYLLEPDWGMIKLIIVFACSAVSGSLASINGERAIAVGASGGIFGLMGALAIYVTEYWGTIPHNRVIFGSVVLIVAISIGLSFFPFVDKWAHVGGAIGGILASMALLRDLPAFIKFDMCKSYELDDIDNTKEREIENEITVIAVDKDQVKSDQIKLYRVSDNIYADVPAITQPAVVKTMNKRAKRWVNIRQVRRTADPKSWVVGEDSMELRNFMVWSVRVLGGVALLVGWVFLTLRRFDVPRSVVVKRVLKELTVWEGVSNDGVMFMAKV